ncbi:PepSY domain-containing protein [Micromonospora costi]|uniref:PepSY domain-containing protein n=1 Tax=Micromonospora costi TaxID=1530042 RepID=A0A3B0AG00_9ACTN|nr:PepSY domain-containing protein [Micromonospora costi]RKN59131.1 hypothetical protein D7193_06010 [Micromonospora costi]
MKRSSMILASAGGAAVLAVAGVAIGSAVADDERNRGTTLAAATVAPTAPGTPDDSATRGTPDDSATRDDSATPDDSATSGTPGGTPTTGGTTTGAPAGGERVGLQRAGEIALARVGGGRIVEIEAEQEHGRPVWSVEIVTGGVEHDVDVDRDSGAVLRVDRDDDGDDDGRHHDGSDDDRDDDDRHHGDDDRDDD